MALVRLSGAEEASFPTISRNSQPLSHQIFLLSFFHFLPSPFSEGSSHIIRWSPNPSNIPSLSCAFWVPSSCFPSGIQSLSFAEFILLFNLSSSFSYYCFHSHASDTALYNLLEFLIEIVLLMAPLKVARILSGWGLVTGRTNHMIRGLRLPVISLLGRKWGWGLSSVT